MEIKSIRLNVHGENKNRYVGEFTVPVIWLKEKAKLHGVEGIDTIDGGTLSDSFIYFIGKNINNIYKSAQNELHKIAEVCPHCNNEQHSVYWDTDKYGYEINCGLCGKVILLCDACMYSLDNVVRRCDWCDGKCFRNRECY